MAEEDSVDVGRPKKGLTVPPFRLIENVFVGSCLARVMLQLEFVMRTFTPRQLNLNSID